MLELFKYESKEIRVVLDENKEPWFVAKDVASILGYVNAQKAIRMHCKKAKCVFEGVTETVTLDNQTKIIPESDVYRLIFRSKLPKAERFEEWVTSEVLPTLRKTGSYSCQQLTPAQILMQQAQFMIEQEKFNQNIAKEIKEVKQIAIEAKINAEEYPKEGFESINRLAKIVGLSNNVVKKIIKIVNPKTTQARKKLPDGSLKPYTAYKIKPVVKFAKKLKRSAVPVGKKSVVFQSPLVPFRFQLI